MFLKSIHIKNYNQFDDLFLDLTYPAGHEKEGKPLEKICIIGDNGTGKTTILELIKEYYELIIALRSTHVESKDNTEVLKKGEGEIVFKNTSDVSGYDFLASKKFKLLHFPTGTDLSKLKLKKHENALKPQMPTFEGKSLIDKLKAEIKEDESKEGLGLLTQENLEKAWSEFTQQTESALIQSQFSTAKVSLIGKEIYVAVNSRTAKESIPIQPGLLSFLRKRLGVEDLEVISYLDFDDNSGKIIYDFNKNETLKLWNFLKSNIKVSIDEELTYRLTTLKEMKNQNEINELKTVLDKIEKFKAKNPNGYDQLAEFLKPVLSKFHLKLNTKFDLEKFEEIEFLDLRTKDGSIISIDKWSTGIRQLIYTILPLYALKPETGVVMIDEAENSLYPSTQRNIIDFYKSICPNMQLIFATHSPILASSFEPWEVVELRFNNEGKVERKLYYEGEKNHVDNYNIHPMYLTWNSLFMDMFGVKGESNDARTKKLMELSILDREVKLTDDKAKKKELFKKYEKIAEQLDWGSL